MSSVFILKVYITFGRLYSTVPQMEDKTQSVPPPKGWVTGWAKFCGHEAPEPS